MKKQKIKKKLVEFKKFELKSANVRKQIKGGGDVECPFCQRHVNSSTLDG